MSNCILCLNPDLTEILNLGNLPLPNNLPEAADPEDERFPLRLALCKNCGLLQLADVVPPEKMFSNYTYVPSESEELRRHFKQLAEQVMAREKILEDGKPDSKNALVMDIGGNDGLLLSYFQRLGMNGVNIDPAENLVPLSKSNGVTTLVAFFDEFVAERFKNSARIVLATNCLAHTANLRTFLKGVSIMLKPNGVFVTEFPYALSMVDNYQFDTIYHEHQSYFTLTPLESILPEFGLQVEHVERIPVHGGSLRVFIRRKGSAKFTDKSVTQMLEKENARRVKKPSTYAYIADDAVNTKKILTGCLTDLVKQGGTLGGLAASAKMSMLLNYCEIGPDILPYVCDANVLKQGKCVPGVRVPIMPESHLGVTKPDYVLVGAWNLRGDMMDKIRKYCPKAKMITPIPTVTIEKVRDVEQKLVP